MRKAQAKLSAERHEGDTLYGFHNVQGLGERAFRRFYLQKMATRFGVLGLAETKCGSPQDESDWARDFPNRKDVFWASSGRAAAGVALKEPSLTCCSDLKRFNLKPRAARLYLAALLAYNLTPAYLAG